MTTLVSARPRSGRPVAGVRALAVFALAMSWIFALMLAAARALYEATRGDLHAAPPPPAGRLRSLVGRGRWHG